MKLKLCDADSMLPVAPELFLRTAIRALLELTEMPGMT